MTLTSERVADFAASTGRDVALHTNSPDQSRWPAKSSWHVPSAPNDDSLLRVDWGQVPTQAERDAVDAEIAAFDWTPRTPKQVSIAELESRFDDARDKLRIAMLVIMDELNILRALHSLPPRQASQIKSALASKMDSEIG